MFSRPSSILCGLAAATIAAIGLSASPALSVDRDKAFFEQVAGQWKGPGEIVAGKYKGTKFTCSLTGLPADGNLTGITLDVNGGMLIH